MRRTVTTCAGVAAAVLAAFAIAGRPLAGVALAAGLLIGSANGWLAQKALGMAASFRATSLGRLALLSVIGLGVGALLGFAYAPLVMIGLGAAQLLIAIVAAKAALETVGR